MSPEKRAALMAAWRDDVRIIAAGGYPKIPSEAWTPLQPLRKRYGPIQEAREAEQALFIGRVIVRLYERGLQAKTFAWIWGLSYGHVRRLHREALGQRRKDRI